MIDVSNANEMLIKWQVAISNETNTSIDIEAWETQLSNITTDIEHWAEAKVLLELLKNHKLEKRKDFILSVINSAMLDIFQEDYRLDILPRVQRGKSVSTTQKYDIIFYQNGIEIAKNDELLSSNGGGVLSIASLFFKILIGYLYSGNKFYIFDESLSQVSPQYRMRLSSFLRTFCDKYGFTLVVVSQTEELEVDAHLVYEVGSSKDSNGVPVLDIVHQEGELPDSGFFYSSIKNFQSIVHQTFVYKGFTVIRGPNNSGKSAALRSIEAIIFNNFHVDTYPRLNPGGKQQPTEILFGYVPTEEEEEKGKEQREIGLIYKGKKVIFIINGKEYFGKSLASDKLKAAVEEIGFKYIDVKKLYKNFKGALKEQTERIAYTSQYDGLFLIGSKTTDSEKIFSFLFNTENIALAIAQVKDTILEMNKEFKDVSVRLIESQEKARKLKVEIEYYNKQYYKYLIYEFGQLREDIAQVANTLELKTEAIELLDKFIKISDSINALNSFEIKMNSTLVSKEHCMNSIELYNNMQALNTRALSILGFIELEVARKQLQQNQKLNKLKIALGDFASFIEIKQKVISVGYRLEEFKALLPRIDFLISISDFIELSKNIDNIKEKLNLNSENNVNLSTEYNLKICSTCSGSGVECIH